LKNKKIIVTGAEGFIGSNLCNRLTKTFPNVRLIGAGNINHPCKFNNVLNSFFCDYLQPRDIHKYLESTSSLDIVGVIHLGACSRTDELDMNYLLQNNHRFSADLIDLCASKNIRLIYASSASVYGRYNQKESKSDEKPLNPYAFSKLLTDRYYVNNYGASSAPIAGLRFFNVFGTGEGHKKGMSSPITTFNNQALENHSINLFEENCIANFNGKYARDFISVIDTIDAIEELLIKPSITGLIDIGSGLPMTFEEVAALVSRWWKKEKGINVDINTVNFPPHLQDGYQPFTKADMSMVKNKKLDWKPEDQRLRIYQCLNKMNNHNPEL